MSITISKAYICYITVISTDISTTLAYFCLSYKRTWFSLQSLSFVHLVLTEMTKEGNSGRLGQLEMTPVSRALARHMCVDLSPEGLAARNRRGIAIVVYGAPLTGEAFGKKKENLIC